MKKHSNTTSSLARDFAALAKKHNLVTARLYPAEGADHLMLVNGSILSYHEPAPRWNKVTKV